MAEQRLPVALRLPLPNRSKKDSALVVTAMENDFHFGTASYTPGSHYVGVTMVSTIYTNTAVHFFEDSIRKDRLESEIGDVAPILLRMAAEVIGDSRKPCYVYVKGPEEFARVVAASLHLKEDKIIKVDDLEARTGGKWRRAFHAVKTVDGGALSKAVQDTLETLSVILIPPNKKGTRRWWSLLLTGTVYGFIFRFGPRQCIAASIYLQDPTVDAAADVPELQIVQFLFSVLGIKFTSGNAQVPMPNLELITKGFCLKNVNLCDFRLSRSVLQTAGASAVFPIEALFPNDAAPTAAPTAGPAEAPGAREESTPPENAATTEPAATAEPARPALVEPAEPAGSADQVTNGPVSNAAGAANELDKAAGSDVLAEEAGPADATAGPTAEPTASTPAMEAATLPVVTTPSGPPPTPVEEQPLSLVFDPQDARVPHYNEPQGKRPRFNEWSVTHHAPHHMGHDMHGYGQQDFPNHRALAIQQIRNALLTGFHTYGAGPLTATWHTQTAQYQHFGQPHFGQQNFGQPHYSQHQQHLGQQHFGQQWAPMGNGLNRAQPQLDPTEEEILRDFDSCLR